MGKKRQQCNDEEGIEIDGCDAQLRHYRPEGYELVIAHFVFSQSLRAMVKNVQRVEFVRYEFDSRHYIWLHHWAKEWEFALIL